MGMGAIAFQALLGRIALAEDLPGTLAARKPHFAPRARRVLHIFANGGPSHVDTFDPKPLLAKYATKSLPGPNPATERRTGAAFPSPFTFTKHGQVGLEVSEIFSKLGEHADDLCVIRSMKTDIPSHDPALLLMNTGEPRLIRPSVGSWVTYGLGTEDQNLPAFVVLCPGGYPTLESQNWQAAFLPGIFQGTPVDPEKCRDAGAPGEGAGSVFTPHEEIFPNIRNEVVTPEEQAQQLGLLRKLNALHQEARGKDGKIEARIQSFELAARMQLEAAEVFDISREPKSVRDLYGPGIQARQLIMARRLLERGVRFVQVYTGAGQPWDNHDELEAFHRALGHDCDQALAGLLSDLKSRGMLDDTLVIWGGEFGRTPTVDLESPSGHRNGRDHNHHGFSMWLAGGGVKRGYIHGATDELGYKAVEKPVHVHDLHATMLHLLGFDHEKLTYRYAGNDFRLTDVYGKVVHDVIA
jgi:hypothetical protein